MTENELSAAIKSRTLSGCYFLYGDEDYMKNHRAAEIRAAVTADAPDFASFNAVELVFGDGEADPEAIADALYTPPLMAMQKLVTLSFSSLDSLKEKDRTALLSLLSDFAADDDGSTVVLVKVSADGFDPGMAKKPSAFLASAQKFMQCIAFDYQSESRLMRWMERHFSEYGLTVSPEVSAAILSACGRSMYRLSGEIAKTAAYTASSGRKQVTPADVAACVSRTDEDDAFALANCILEGNTSAALQSLGVKIRKREEPVFLLTQISRVFCDLCAASLFILDGREKADYAREMKMHEYKAGLYFRAAKLKDEAFFIRAAELCTDADRKMKSGGGGGDGYGLIEELICTLCED
ncbi:MAG: DNA polymerase III subunit delta [Clostridia bacterium]|nr:DNA polymerase III subunit delta [Clostridia bacterium]